MKCAECVDFVECSKKNNLTIKRKRCPMAKVEYVQTNADRIRAMSDEELADFIDEPILCKGHGLGDCMSKGCNKCILEWLKQPAEVDDG